MSTDAVAILGFIALFALMLLPRAGGHGDGPRRRLRLQLPGRRYAGASNWSARPRCARLTDYTFGVIPMFFADGDVRQQFRHEPRTVPPPPTVFVGHLRVRAGDCHGRGLRRLCRHLRLVGGDRRDVFGGWPIRRCSRFGYPQSFATGVIAAGGTLGAMLPPSTVLSGIRHHHRAGHRQAVHRRHHSRPARHDDVHDHHRADRLFPAGFPAKGHAHPHGASAFAGLKNIWAPVLLFVFVIGGLYGLPFLPRFTPTEAGGVGATGAFLIGVATGRLDKDKILTSLLQATRNRRRCLYGADRRIDLWIFPSRSRKPRRRSRNFSPA